MYERKIAELIKQLEDQHLLYRSEQEKLLEAKKHLNEYQQSMQVLILHLLKSQIVCSYSFRTFYHVMDDVAIPILGLENVAISLS